MNTKHFILGAIALFAASSAQQVAAQPATYAEEQITVVEFLPTGKTYYYSPSPRNNWFMSLGAGTQTLFAEHKGKAQFSLALAVDFGKWFSPYWGLRLSAVGGELRLRYPTENDMLHYKDVIISADFMWDMTNLIGGYDPYRIVSVQPFIGVLGGYVFQNPLEDQTFSMGGTGGIRVSFRLCPFVDLYAEGKASIMGDDFNGILKSKKVDASLAVIGGLVINFRGKQQFKSYNPVEDEFMHAAMNGQINNLRGALAACNSKKCPPCPPAAPAPAPQKEVVMEPSCNTELTSAVRFELNSSEITNEEMVNVYNIAEWMKNNPKCTVTVAGYADKDTGTPKYNMNLSKQRADAVVKILTDKYNIPAKRIKIVAGGSQTQPYPDHNNWNRVVIFKEMPADKK